MRGILFTELLFNKTVNKEKTQTRRAGKELSVINENTDEWGLHQATGRDPDFLSENTPYTGVYRNFGAIRFKNQHGISPWIKPRYKVDEVLYLKEPTFLWGDKLCIYKYGATFGASLKDGTPFILKDKYPKWSNKLFMPNERARHFIKITGIKCERLFDISEEDCIKEGIEWDYDEDLDADRMIPIKHYMDYSTMEMKLSPEFNCFDSYESLFRFANSIPKNKELENVWCFVYDYVLCDKEGKPI